MKSKFLSESLWFWSWTLTASSEKEDLELKLREVPEIEKRIAELMASTETVLPT